MKARRKALSIICPEKFPYEIEEEDEVRHQVCLTHFSYVFREDLCDGYCASCFYYSSLSKRTKDVLDNFCPSAHYLAHIVFRFSGDCKIVQ